MSISGALVLLVWALMTISVWCNAIYGVRLTHADGLNARQHRAVKLGLAFGEKLSPRWPLIVSYVVRIALATGSAVAWLFAFGWLL